MIILLNVKNKESSAVIKLQMAYTRLSIKGREKTIVRASYKVQENGDEDLVLSSFSHWPDCFSCSCLAKKGQQYNLSFDKQSIQSGNEKNDEKLTSA